MLHISAQGELFWPATSPSPTLPSLSASSLNNKIALIMFSHSPFEQMSHRTTEQSGILGALLVWDLRSHQAVALDTELKMPLCRYIQSHLLYPRHFLHWQVWKAVSLPGLSLMPADLLEWAFPALAPPKWEGQSHLDLSIASLPLLVLVWLYVTAFNVILNNTRETYLVAKQTYTIPCTVQTVFWTPNQTWFSFPVICLPVSVQQLQSSYSEGKIRHS